MNSPATKRSFLQNIHLYPKVPRDLTDGTRVGGAMSLTCAGLMAYLFISNIMSYLDMSTTTDVVLDDTGDVHMRLFFNVTMVHTPALSLSAALLCAALLCSALLHRRRLPASSARLAQQRAVSLSPRGAAEALARSHR